MLSDTDLLAGISAGTYSITYSFLRNTDGSFKYCQPASNPNASAEALDFFRLNLTRSRIALTLGALVKPLSAPTQCSSGQRFGEHSGIIDLRKCREGWPLAPGQSAVLFTNECIRLPSDLVGLVLGRVSSYNNGLVIASSYIDSTWDGLVKLHITNTSARSVRLLLGMEIARLFLIRTHNASVDGSGVTRQGIHYGFTWARILGDEIDPFPQSSAPKSRQLGVKLRAANELFQRYAGYGLIALAGLAVAGGMRVYTKVTEALGSSENYAALASRVADLKADAALAGSQTIVVPSGERNGRAEFPLPKETRFRGADSFSFAVVGSPLNRELAAATSLARRGDQLFLIIVVSSQHPAKADIVAEIRWVVVP